MKIIKKSFLLAAAVIMSAFLVACTDEDLETASQIVSILAEENSVEETSIDNVETQISEEPEVSPSEEEVSVKYVDYYFRSNKLLNQHYEKHGIDMGFDDAKSYEKAASDVINNPKALTKTEKEDGDYIYYIEETNEFVVLSVDGYIRTYFLPDAGKKYYDKQ